MKLEDLLLKIADPRSRGLVRRPRAVRMRGDAGQVDTAGAVLDDDQRGLRW
jgi:hypothetical protein